MDFSSTTWRIKWRVNKDSPLGCHFAQAGSLTCDRFDLGVWTSAQYDFYVDDYMLQSGSISDV